MLKRTCAEDGCEGASRSLGLCLKHYTRLHRNGTTDLLNRKTQPETCTIEGCEKPTRYHGWCRMHAARWERHGDTAVVIVKQRAEVVAYRQAHKRLCDDRGPASDHSCQHCGMPAQDWAYNHADPDERQSEHGPYSLDPAHYLPLCRRCHSYYDRRR
jgi:hypothetical protein